jgi:predicted TIM-barrel enzyme
MFGDVHVYHGVTLANSPLNIILHDISLVSVSAAVVAEERSTYKPAVVRLQCVSHWVGQSHYFRSVPR